MQFDAFKEFVELANNLSFSKAAQKLYVSQPTLSSHINDLEKEVGAQLVIRERQVRLTAAGRLFYQNANKMLELYHETIDGCRALESTNEKGAITIKAAYAFESVKTPFRQLIASFRKKYPSVDVTVASGARASLIEDLTLGRINCGFFSTSFDECLEQFKDEVAVEEVLVAQASLALWMRPSYPLTKKDKLSIHDIEGRNYPMPSGDQFAELRTAAWEVMKIHNVKPHSRSVLVDSFEEYLYSIEEDDVFLGVEYPFDEAKDLLVCRTFEPDIKHRNYFVVKVEECNWATPLFLEYVKQHVSLFSAERQVSTWTA